MPNENEEPPHAETEDVFEARRRLVKRFHAPDMAFGLGGQRAELIGSLDGGLVLGGLVVIDDETGAPLVAQLQGSQLVEQQLGDVELVLDAETLGTTIRNATVTPVLRAMRGDLLVLGRLRGDTFEPGAPAHGFAESRYRPATEAETRLVLDHLAGTDASLTIGEVLGAAAVPARLRAKGFARHTFLCGQSGSGKTYATGVMLERLRLETSLPMLVLDPNSDHVHLGQVRTDAEDHPDAARYRAKADEVLVARARGKGGDHLLAVHFSELAFREQTLLLGLDPVADLDLYASFREAVAGLGEVYSVRDVRDGRGGPRPCARAATSPPASTTSRWPTGACGAVRARHRSWMPRRCSTRAWSWTSAASNGRRSGSSSPWPCSRRCGGGGPRSARSCWWSTRRTTCSPRTRQTLSKRRRRRSAWPSPPRGASSACTSCWPPSARPRWRPTSSPSATTWPSCG